MARVQNRATRKDRNHKEIVAHFRSLGWHVLDISGIPNAADILISKNRVSIAIEIKDGLKSPSQQKLTKGEIKFAQEFLGIYHIVNSIEVANEIDEEYSY